MAEKKSRVLVIGATGTLGKHVALASVAMHHPTFALIRPSSIAAKHDLVASLQSAGVFILEGSLGDHHSLVSAISQVDIVISAVSSQHLIDQLNIIWAVKQVGTVKRFVPSEYGVDPDHVQGIGPFQASLDLKRKIRRATEEAGIHHTYISSFGFAYYFLKNLMQPGLSSPPRDNVVIYGSGDAKAAFVLEEDVGFFITKIADDPRTLNKTVHLRPIKNVLSQNEVTALWERKIGLKLHRVFLSEEELVKEIEGKTHPHTAFLSYAHVIFVNGGHCNFKLGPKDVEAQDLYPLLPYARVDEILETHL